jgi:uncharacterized membrane protein YeaQ/YmgE (transglycosylase-associated protein family)
MTVILFFTVLGFLAGLAYIIVKRKIKVSGVLSATFLGLIAAAISKIIKENYKRRGY